MIDSYQYEPGDWWRLPMLLVAIVIGHCWHRIFPIQESD